MEAQNRAAQNRAAQNRAAQIVPGVAAQNRASARQALPYDGARAFGQAFAHLSGAATLARLPMGSSVAEIVAESVARHSARR